MIDDETFFAWLDGELAPNEAARVEAAVAADPDLQRRAAEHRGAESGLRGAFDRVARAPVPESLTSAVQRRGRVVSLAEARERRSTARLPLWQQFAAMAATLVVGIAVGNTLVPGSGGSSPIVPEAGRLVASAELEDALYARLASAPAGEGPRILLTYRSRDGEICRTFQEGSADGLACREQGDWRIRALFQDRQAQAGDYRMASAGDPRLLELVDASMAGEPFDAAQEKAAMERGWK